MKRNKIYTVNKWNKNLFWPGGPTQEYSTMGTNKSGLVIGNPYSVSTERSGLNSPIANYNDYLGDNALSFSQGIQQAIGNDTDYLGTGNSSARSTAQDNNTQAVQRNSNGNSLLPNTLQGIGQLAVDYGKNALSNSGRTAGLSTVSSLASPLANAGLNASTYAGRQAALSQIGNMTTQFGKDAQVITSGSNLFGKSFEDKLMDSALSSTGSTATKFSSLFGADKLSSAEGAGLGVAAGVVGGLGKTGISDGFNTKTGNTIATIGNLAGSAVGAINPVVGGIVTLAGNVIGGVVNRGWGHKVYGKANAQNYLNQMSGFNANGSNDNIEQLASTLATPEKVTYRDGWFTNKGKKEAQSWNNKTSAAYDFADRSIGNAAVNNIASQQRSLLENYAAFGGNIESATEYGLLTDLINNKKKDMESKNKITSMPNSFFGNDNIFAIGGVLQSHGANWGNVSHINAGGSHETNPNQGVQYSTDSEGTPNMVEENEVVWNDFVFSNRINVPKAVRQKYGIRGKKELSFADAAKKLQKESEERPNDPISIAGLNASLEDLANAQEELKQAEQARQAQEEFAKLSPEQQQQVMQELAARQQAAQEQAVAQQQASPEQQQMMQEQAQPTISAYGGNLYEDGGVLKLLKSLGFKSTTEAEKAGFTPQDFGVDAWTKINNTTALPKDFAWNNDWNSRLVKDIQARLSLGWSPVSELVQPTWYEPAGGNNIGWSASVPLTDLNAEQYADTLKRYANTAGYADKQGWIKAPGEGQTISTKDIQAAMMRTPDWIATDKWLYDDTNARANQEEYLGTARSYNDPDDQKFIDKWSKYGDFTTEDGKNYKFKLREGLSADDYNKFLEQFKKSRNDEFLGVMHNSRTSVPETLTNYQYDPETGKILGVLTDTTGYQSLGDKFTWGDKDTNRNAQFWVAKGTEGNGNNPNGKANTAQGDIEPIHKAEWPRYVGLMGPAAGLGLQALGIGKPDTSGLDAAVNASSVNPIMAAYKPIGDHLTYKPLDTDYELNKLSSMAGASRRAILNSGSTPQRAAAILASDNQMMGKVGDLYRAASEYNQAQKEKVRTFNRDTHKYNADAFNRAALQYASDYNNQKRFNAQLQMEAARQKMDAQAGWYNSLYGNIGQLAAGIGNLGKENAQHNMIADMAAQGVFGVMDPDSPMGSRVVRYSNKASKGGKLNRRKKGGLTY